MTHQESILAYLQQRDIQLCDDCLGQELAIQPRQTVNQVCRSLANQGVICRSENRCNQCRKAKLVNRMAAERQGIEADTGARPDPGVSEEDDAMKHEILGYVFNVVSTIEPDGDEEANVHQFQPQARYRNPHGLRLHRHGAGPFCQFRIPRDLPLAGVYTIAVDEEIVYLGECQNLSERFNARGYGTISPRNCFQGGQPTNCRVNNLILKNAKEGRKIELWFHQTSDRKFIEAELIRQLQPRWNSQLK